MNVGKKHSSLYTTNYKMLIVKGNISLTIQQKEQQPAVA